MVDFRVAEAGLKDFAPTMDRVGITIVSHSQLAFELQTMQGVLWPEQYPGLPDDDFINIAGAIVDLNEGGQIRERNLKRGPALLDAGFGGGLISTIAHEVVSDDSVVAGAGAEYAEKHQVGGPSLIPITSEAKQGLKDFADAEDEEAEAGPVELAFGLVSGRSRIARAFSKKDFYSFDVARRPFMPFGDFEDWNEDLQDDVIEALLDGIGAAGDIF